jgi:hypothetical protein
VYLLPKRRRSIQEDNYWPLGAPSLRYLDSRIDSRKCDIHGASSGCGATAEKQVEAGTYIRLVKTAADIQVCSLCHERVGACIQCENKQCFTAFHVTCARQAGQLMTMKTLGTEGVLKAYCDKHLPVSSPDHSRDIEADQSRRI